MTESVLIVDDNSKLRRLYVEIMEFMGYETVLAADHKLDKLFFEKKPGISLILLASGGSTKDTLQVFREIKAVDRHLPVIHIVDPDNRPRFNQELENGCIANLELPLRVAELEP